MGKKSSKITINKVLTVIIIILAIFLLIGGNIAWKYVSSPGRSGLYPIKGLDVSHYQGDIDFKGLKSEGFSFVYIKATEGSDHVDPNFETNWNDVHWSGVSSGAYHFLSFDSDGESQAQNYINNVSKRIGSLPPAVDVEFYGKYENKRPSKEKMYAALDPLLESLENRYHKKPVIYTNKHIYDRYIAGKYDDYPIWISDWDVADKLSDDKDWTFCQYTFEGRAVSIGAGEKDIDLNVYHGSMWSLIKFKYFDKQ